MTGAPKKLRVDTFPNPVGHSGFCRWCGIAGGERVPTVPLGWYLVVLLLKKYQQNYQGPQVVEQQNNVTQMQDLL